MFPWIPYVPIPLPWWSTAEWFAAASAAATVGTALAALTALAYAKVQIDDARRRDRHQLMREFMIRWSSAQIIKGRRIVNKQQKTGEAFYAYYQKESDQDSNSFYSLVTLGNYFEDMAIRVQEKLLDQDDVLQTMRFSIQHYLGIYREVIEKRGVYAEWHKVFGSLCDEDTDSTVPDGPAGGAAAKA